MENNSFKLKTVEVTRLERFMRTGRTSPILCNCIDTGQLTQNGNYVIKCLGSPGLSNFALANELICSLLADHFEIHHPSPALAIITSEFVEACEDTLSIDKIEILRKSIGVNFASECLEELSIWPTNQKISNSEIEQAATIFAFDSLIQNSDRRLGNPNLFLKGNKLTILDHELCFLFVSVLLKTKLCSSSWREM